MNLRHAKTYFSIVNNIIFQLCIEYRFGEMAIENLVNGWHGHSHPGAGVNVCIRSNVVLQTPYTSLEQMHVFALTPN
jgi:hypothetical protein